MDEVIELVESLYGSGAAMAVADLLKEYENEEKDSK
jgi:hypothetical protein